MEIDVFERKTEEIQPKFTINERFSQLIEKINVVKVISIVITVLASRVSIFGGLMPFGISLFATEFSHMGLVYYRRYCYCCSLFKRF